MAQGGRVEAVVVPPVVLGDVHADVVALTGKVAAPGAEPNNGMFHPVRKI